MTFFLIYTRNRVRCRLHWTILTTNNMIVLERGVDGRSLLLMHWEVRRDISDFHLYDFGIHWVMHVSIRHLTTWWKSDCKCRRKKRAQNVAPFCIMRCLRREGIDTFFMGPYQCMCLVLG